MQDRYVCHLLITWDVSLYKGQNSNSQIFARQVEPFAISHEEFRCIHIIKHHPQVYYYLLINWKMEVAHNKINNICRWWWCALSDG